jgi:hypothetical protein
MVLHRNISGIVARFCDSENICNWCTASVDDINKKANFEVVHGKKVYKCPEHITMRTPERMTHNAHCFWRDEQSFTCPCCDVLFTRDTYDEQIASYTKKQQKEHSKLHEGQGYLMAPLFPFLGQRCEMHARKGNTGYLYKMAIGGKVESLDMSTDSASSSPRC